MQSALFLVVSGNRLLNEKKGRGKDIRSQPDDIRQARRRDTGRIFCQRGTIDKTGRY